MTNKKLDYGHIEPEAMELATEVARTIEDCFVEYGVDDFDNMRNYIGSMLMQYREHHDDKIDEIRRDVQSIYTMLRMSMP